MDDLAPLTDTLHRHERPRVWSLVITIFGDAAQHRGGQMPLGRLQALTERIGIEPGALRTALSRLARDGWVTRARNGRSSVYRLSTGRGREVHEAARLIYAPPAAGPIGRWTLAHGVAAPAGGIEVGASLWLLPHGASAPLPDHLCVTGTLDTFPRLAARRALTAEHEAALLALIDDTRSLSNSRDLSPLDAMAARILLIHGWRRIVLRWPELPAQLLPAGFSSHEPRAVVAQTYRELLPASESWLDSPWRNLGPMPAAQAPLWQRFTADP